MAKSYRGSPNYGPLYRMACLHALLHILYDTFRSKAILPYMWAHKVTHWQRVFIVVVLTYHLRTFRCTITERYITNEGGLIHGYYSYYWLFTTANFQQFFLHFSQVYESPWNAQMHFRRRMLAQTQQTNGLVCMCCKHVASNIIFLNIPNNKRESYSSDKADQICPRILSL